MEKFCKYQFLEENADSNDFCCKVRSYDIVFKKKIICPFGLNELTYENPYQGRGSSEDDKELIVRSFSGTRYADGVCRDFKPVENKKVNLIEIAKRNTEKVPSNKLIANLE